MRFAVLTVLTVAVAACGSEVSAPGITGNSVVVTQQNPGGDPANPSGDPDGDAGATPTDDGGGPHPVASLQVLSTAAQTARGGAPVTSDPSVKALDASGHPVVGAVITFTVSGGGLVSPDTVTTDANGVATVTYWQLGKAVAPQALDATADGGATAHFTATIDTQFAIQLMFIDTFPAAQEQAFTDAANRWSAVIVNDLADTSVTRSMFDSSCAGAPDDTPIPIDDLLIFVEVHAIDGVGGILAASGPCAARNGTDAGSVAVGIMNFDSADVDFLDQHSLLKTTVLHEMGHVIGFGSLWKTYGFIQNPSLTGSTPSPGVDTIYTGGNGQAAFNTLTMNGYSGGGVVPADNTGKAGSADAHWRENVLGTELMTSVLTGHESAVPLSSLTIMALSDFGFYHVNAFADDPYTFGQALVIAEQARPDGDSVTVDGCQVLTPTQSTPVSPTLTRLR